MANKTDLALDAQRVSTSLASAVNQMKDLVKTYFDRGYSSGGANPILDGQLVALQSPISANDLASFITMSQQLVLFFGGEATLQSDYQSTLNKMRTDI